MLSDLPPGLNLVGIDCPEFYAPRDIWMGVTWGSGAYAGLLLADPATEGYSYNMFEDMLTGDQEWFGGYPAANFALGVYTVVPEPGTIAGLAVGLLGIAALRRRR